jgi:tRNA modification GTPase
VSKKPRREPDALVGALDGDTIAAVATAPGQAGVGIVRVSGPVARPIGETLTRTSLKPRRALHRRFLDAGGEAVDSGLVLYFEGPASFTGEDVVEFQGHGGPVVLSMVLDRILECGARLARPGEFTERAYLNGKMDLTQAEAVADLIAGSTEEAVRGANRSLAGEFSKRIYQIDRAVVELRMFVEAAIDFPDEDIDLLVDGQVDERATAIRNDLESLEADCAQGVVLRDGISLALIGAPNVGKSSLLNRLAGESRAIVTDIPGTTRDLVRADLSLDGLAVEVVDTAGLREASDAVELEGVRRALAEAAQADFVVMIEALKSNEWSVGTTHLPDGVDARQVIAVLNKIDLAGDVENVAEHARQAGFIALSAETGQGVDALRSEIIRRAGYSSAGQHFTARKRHLVALGAARAAAERSIELARDSLPGELIAEELRAVHAALGEIVGEMSSDALLGEIFSRFCIGK